jgi:hypothetical protein
VYARDILFRGSVLEGLSVGLAALHRAEQSRNGALTVNVAGSLSFFLWATGPLAEVIEVTDRAFKMTRGDDRAGAGMTFACPVAQCEFTRMLAFGDLGRIDDPRASRRRAIALACEHGDPMIEIHTQYTHALVTSAGRADQLRGPARWCQSRRRGSRADGTSLYGVPCASASHTRGLQQPAREVGRRGA